MSTNGIYYYPTDPANSGWGSDWNVGQQYNTSYMRNSFPYTNNSHLNNHNIPLNRCQNYNGDNRHCQQRRYNMGNAYNGNIQRNWQERNKRQRCDTSADRDCEEPQIKTSKKKKKPLSQTVPSKRVWKKEEAEKALNIEQEYNQRHADRSLIIHFPDEELNKDIVRGYNSDIEEVYFQQPSRPRFCFVTLKKSADPTAVIEHLKQIKFGTGYLTSEKKNQSKNKDVGPDDIDPLTLYVGNLGNVRKEDIVNIYPKYRRIDIGYAIKIKKTRYAIVSFRTVADAIEAFKKTHGTDMHGKSLIVRFRRLNGSIGMPGESKSQNNVEKKIENSPSDENIDLNHTKGALKDDEKKQLDIDKRLEEDHDKYPTENHNEYPTEDTNEYFTENHDEYFTEDHDEHIQDYQINGTKSNDSGGGGNNDDNDGGNKIEIDLNRVKQEPVNYEEEFEKKPVIKQEFISLLAPGSNNLDVVPHRPRIEYIKQEVGKDIVKQEEFSAVSIKKEPIEQTDNAYAYSSDDDFFSMDYDNILKKVNKK